MTIKAFISGCSGHALTVEERRFFEQEQPWGLILFARNISDRDQVAALTRSFRESVGRADAPVLVDEEGGRVQRMKPPTWPTYPPGALFGALYDEDPDRGLEAVRIGARLIADDLHGVGITVDCLPLLDVADGVMHDAIGDRAYGSDPDIVIALGRAGAEGLQTGGVLPVFKHTPGYGRATVDPHHDLPVVDADRRSLAERDFRPFKALRDLPIGMTGHIKFIDLDEDNPVTTSKTVIDDVIRGEIGFPGLLLTDDISMNALGGTVGMRAGDAIRAGCDIVLHCNGEMDEMIAVAEAVPPLQGLSAERAERALSERMAAAEFDRAEAIRRFEHITGHRVH